MKKFYLFTIIFALLGISQAWGETCYVFEDLMTNEGTTVHIGDDVIYTTANIGNTDGVDTIRFEYWAGDRNIKLQYSSDGENFTDLPNSEKGKFKTKDTWRGKTGNGTDIYVVITDANIQKNIQYIRFRTVSGGLKWGEYDYKIRKIQVTKLPTLKLDKSSDVFPKIAVETNTSKTYTVSTWNVKSAINVAISGDNASLFSYELSEPTGSCPTERTLTITYSPDEASESHSALVTVSTDDASSATLSLTASADAEVDPVYTCNIADKYYVEDDELDLATLWTSTSTGAITYTIVSFEAASGDQEGATAPAIRENRYLSLGEAGILNLKLSQVEKGAYGEGEDTKTVTIVRRTPEFTWYAGDVYYNTTIENFCVSNQSDTEFTLTSSDDQIASVSGTTVTTFNKPGKVTFTASQVGNYKWAEKNDVKEVTLSKKVNHVPFEMNNAAVRDLLYVGVSSDGTINCEDDGRIVLTQGGAAWTSNELYYIIRFDGIPDQLSYTYRSTSTIATSYGRGDAFVVYESATGADDSWTEVDGSKKEVPGDTDDHNVDPLSLKSTTRYLKFYFHATYTGNFKNIKVTELKQFDAEDVNFGDIEINSEVAEKTLTFKHANAGYNVSVDFEEAGETKFFTIDHLTVANTGGDKCGEENFLISFNPSALGAHTATVTFSDQLGNEKVVTLSAKVKKNPAVTAPEAKELTYNEVAQELVNAGETEGGTLQYCLGEGEWGTSIPTATNAGDYVVKYRVVGNDSYFDVAEASVNVTVAKATPVITTAPQAADIKIGQKLSDSELFGGEASVPGTFTWADDTIEPDSVKVHTYKVIFTPTDTENYNTVEIDVEVKVTGTETAVDNTASEVKATKILRNGQIFIVRDGKVYNLNGQEVR